MLKYGGLWKYVKLKISKLKNFSLNDLYIVFKEGWL